MHLVPLTSSRKAHDNIQPTMTQVVPQLSLETIFRDYCRGVLHPELSRNGIFDPEWVDDDNIDFFHESEDISEFVDNEPLKAPIKEDLPQEDIPPAPEPSPES